MLDIATGTGWAAPVAVKAVEEGIWLDIPALFAIGHKPDGSRVHEAA